MLATIVEFDQDNKVASNISNQEQSFSFL